MSPCYSDLAADNRLEFVCWRVFIHLERKCLDYSTARETKVWLIADTLGLGRSSVCRSLNWLVANGYLIEHERGSRGVRRFTLVWTKETPKAA